jgi:hypothetical protein
VNRYTRRDQANILNSTTRIGFLEDRYDLGLGESRLLHLNLLAKVCQKAPIIAGPLLGEGYGISPRFRLGTYVMGIEPRVLE